MAIALVANILGVSVGGADVTTSSINTSTATLLVVACSDYLSISAKTITDSKGNTWHPLTASTANNSRMTLHYAYDSSGSALAVGAGHTFSTTGAGTGYPVICVMAFSGTLTTDPFDVENGAGSTAITGQPGLGITPTQPNTVVVCGVGGDDTSNESVNSGMTLTDQSAFSSGQHFYGGAAYIIQTSATAINPTWTSVGACSHAIRIASFKAAGAATGSASSLMLRGVGN